MCSPIQIVDGKLELLGTHALSLHIVALLSLLLVATIVDVRVRRIPNWLVAMGMVVGTTFHALAPQGAGISFALLGLIVGIAFLFPLYALRAMGAGDVKLMGMIGAFLGAYAILGVIIATMAAGGIFALAIALCKRMLPQLLLNVHIMLFQRRTRHSANSSAVVMTAMPSIGKMPYAIAISIGTVVQMFVLRY